MKMRARACVDGVGWGWQMSYDYERRRWSLTFRLCSRHRRAILNLVEEGCMLDLKYWGWILLFRRSNLAAINPFAPGNAMWIQNLSLRFPRSCHTGDRKTERETLNWIVLYDSVNLDNLSLIDGFVVINCRSFWRIQGREKEKSEQGGSSTVKSGKSTNSAS